VRGPGSDVFIFDGGTGLRQLGTLLQDEFKDRKLRIHFFSTHCHGDHIQGIPFFAPLYDADCELIFYSSVNSPDIEQAIA
jgi:phosphoribosyl 1,2-cyclic phosphodiesterase